jgi:hypothetical protein
MPGGITDGGEKKIKDERAKIADKLFEVAIPEYELTFSECFIRHKRII